MGKQEMGACYKDTVPTSAPSSS